MNLLDHISLLFDSCLYEDVSTVASFVLTLGDHNPEMLSVLVRYQILYYQAEAFYHLEEYKRAVHVYNKALQVKKMMNKSRVKTPPTDIPSETEIRYKIHLCLFCQKQYKEAISELEGISAKLRTSKINLALARLYHRVGVDRCAITAYKEVLRECPMSLEAAKGLLQLGVKGVEVETLVRSSLPSTANLDWLFSWLKGQAFSASKEYSSSAQTLKVLDNKPLLRDNVHVLCSLGEAQFLNGDYSQAMETLQRARHTDPFSHSKMDVLAYQLCQEKSVKDLESLSTKLMAVSENAPEAWTAVGYFCMATKKATRAVYFAQKALNIDNRNIEGLLLKGAALLELKKIQEAVMHFREALRLAPHRFEAYKGLVNCYLAGRRNREAMSCAGQACKQLATARSLTLYASVLAKETFTMMEKAKGYLEKALKMDPNYLEAVYIMVEIYQEQDEYDKGIELLNNQLNKHTTCRLYQLMGDCLAFKNDYLGALDQFSKALQLDPTNQLAKEGMERVQKHEDVSLESTYDVEVDELEGSDTEGDSFMALVQNPDIMPYQFEPTGSGSDESDHYSE